jgi:hypothetical protein
MTDDPFNPEFQPPVEPPKASLSPHFFRREADGSVRVRIRFTAEEAAIIEEGAGDTPLLLYIHRVLNDRARYHIRKRAQVEAQLDAEIDAEIDEEEAP